MIEDLRGQAEAMLAGIAAPRPTPSRGWPSPAQVTQIQIVIDLP